MTWEQFLCFIGLHLMKWGAPVQTKMRVWSNATWKYEDSFPLTQKGACTRKDCGYARRREL